MASVGTCEWAVEDSAEYTELYHTDCGRFKQESARPNFKFTYCPFCGKVIVLK